MMMTPATALELDIGTLRHADSAKWTKYPADVLPLWVADMDFPVAPSIRQALEERLRRPIGYHHVEESPHLMRLLREKLERAGMTGLPEKGWVGFLTGVVPGIYAAVLGLSSPGEEVLTLTPIYPPFLSAITDHGRRSRVAPMVEGEQWGIDWEAMEAAVTPATRVLLFCHPHNPTGRVWTVGELERLAGFVERHRLWMVCDELHADLTLEGTHVPFVSVASAEVRLRTVTLTGPCKAYNTAGLGIGAMVSHNAQVISRIKKASAGVAGHPNAMSVTMWEAALQDDGAWLAAVLAYLRGNRAYLAAFVKERLPGVRMTLPQATYLAWLDYRAHAHAADIQRYLLEKAKVALNDGPMFGAGYQGFVRLNFATSRAILTEAPERLAAAHG